MSRRHAGWRKRAWAYIVWTALAVGVAFWVNVTAKPAAPPSRDSVILDFDFPSDEVLWHTFIFFAWVVGFGVIWAVGRLSNAIRDRIRDEREERAWAKEREMRAIAKERKDEPRRF